MDSFVQMTFGKDLSLLGAKYYDSGETSLPLKISPASIPFSTAFDFAQDQIDFRFSTVAGWQVFMKLVSSIGKRMEASCRVLDDYAYSLIDEQMADLSQTSDGEKEEAEPTDLLGIFMHTHDERGGGLGRIELRDTALNLIIAGRDTTAEALSWNFFHLLMNRDFISKIRKEAFEILSENQGRVTYANYKRFVWTNATILEALRLHPSVPKNAKCVVSHDQIPGGTTVKAGDMV
ncbi:hypothetical protein PTTG_25622 [Puccinia triticina 1-1 BBBD Race 1]|uniref:Cytochrome P450 n=1 Tax=Puccinia triticina (isolate 1-1 / race 1 (BBBD)) TaxID=630390 RepID=A0A180H116_PUCT1|nr:hypothetical protein PTTG_25622 [Puccinia triticina 1-1 BBBD Race 1]